MEGGKGGRGCGWWFSVVLDLPIGWCGESGWDFGRGMMTPRPHISEAVRSLRRWVTLSALVVVCSCVSQMLVYAFARYTDVPRAEIVSAEPVRGLTVLQTSPVVVPGQGVVVDRSPSGSGVGGGGNVSRTVGGVSRVGAGVGGNGSGVGDSVGVGGVGGVGGGYSSAADPNLGISSRGVQLARTAGVTTTVGLLAVLLMASLVVVGTVVAGGGAIPGVEKAVAATVWSLVLVLLSLPWRDILPSTMLPGVFTGYEALVLGVQQYGTGGELVRFVMLPIVAIVITAYVCLAFRSGVQRGIIYTSVSEIDEALEREMASIRKRGVSQTMPRAVGALHRAVGDGGVGGGGSSAAGSVGGGVPGRGAGGGSGGGGVGAGRALKNDDGDEDSVGGVGVGGSGSGKRRSTLSKSVDALLERDLGEPYAGDGLKRPI